MCGSTVTADTLTIQALRSDMALQLSRFVQREGASQVATAKRLGIPQPTLSKIVRGEVDSLSLELLIRVAVRAELPFVLQTGKEPAEAGVFVSSASFTRSTSERSNRSAVNEGARTSMTAGVRRMKPAERLEALATHTEALVELRDAGKALREAARLQRGDR